MKHKRVFSLAAILVLACVTMGAHSTAQGQSVPAAATSILKAGNDLALKLYTLVTGTPVQPEAGDKVCGSITCPANSLCCPGCNGNMYCLPKRSSKGACLLIPCPAP